MKQEQANLGISPNDSKPITQKLDELTDFLFETSSLSRNKPESFDDFLQTVSFEIFSEKAIIVEGLGRYADGFPIPDDLGASHFFPYKQGLWDKKYCLCTTADFNGHCETLIIANDIDSLVVAKKVYDERMKNQRVDFERSIEQKEQNEKNKIRKK